jgi:hypothetical protein
MIEIEYAVIADLPDEATAQEYLAWLTDGGHVGEVVGGGASVGEAVRLDPEVGEGGDGGRVRVMSRYRFPSRAAFDGYVRDHAPRLRADGLARFGAERGISMMRIVGEVCHRVV